MLWSRYPILAIVIGLVVEACVYDTWTAGPLGSLCVFIIALVTVIFVGVILATLAAPL